MSKKIYLDYQATTPVSKEILEKMIPYFSDNFGNPHSNNHSYGRNASEAVEEARENIANLINANKEEIIFTSGATESNNFAILGVALALNSKKRHIVTCEVEHAAILNPLKQLEALGFHVDYLPVDNVGRVDPKKVKDALKDSTCLVTIQHANSEVGTLQNIKEIGSLIKNNDILFHTDAVQSVGKLAVNVNDISVDLVICFIVVIASSFKIFCEYSLLKQYGCLSDIVSIGLLRLRETLSSSLSLGTP